MRFETQVTVQEVLRDRPRPGYAESYHQVVFRIESAGIDPLELGVWVHPAFPEDALVPVARAFLGGRLTEMTAAAADGALSPEEVDALWETVKP